MLKSKRHSSKSTHFIVEVRDGNLVVSLPNGKFKATYYKPTGRPHLILRERTRTDDHELLDEAFRTSGQGTRAWLDCLVQAASVGALFALGKWRPYHSSLDEAMLTLGAGLRAGRIEWKPQAEPRCIPPRRGFFVFTVAAKSQ